MVFQSWLLKPVVMFSIDKQATSTAPSLLPPTFFISLHVYLTPPFKPHFCVHLSILFFAVKPTLFMISFWSSYWSASSSTSICYLTSCPTAAPPFLLILLVTMVLFSLLLSLPTFKAACLGNVRTCILLLFLVLLHNLTPGNHCCQCGCLIWKTKTPLAATRTSPSELQSLMSNLIPTLLLILFVLIFCFFKFQFKSPEPPPLPSPLTYCFMFKLHTDHSIV